jgi:uncharacterized protein YfaS (alpha-2-macroglobulin family)
MPHRSLTASLAVICLALGASCFNESKPPSVVPTRVLAPAREGSTARATGPVAVLFHEPDGQQPAVRTTTGGGRTADPSSSGSPPVAVVFDRPMQRTGAQGSLPSILAKGGASPKGTWRWVGQSAVTFAPEARLPFATDFEVTVPAGLLAEDGNTLTAPYTFRFSTARPALVSIDPREGQVPTKAVFEAEYNQPVALEEVLRTAQLAWGPDRKTAPLEARWSTADSKTRVTLAPKEPLPPAVAATLTFDGSLHGTEGALTSGKTEHFDVKTIGPLALVSAQRAESRPGGRCAKATVAIELTNPVTVGELKAHARFDPPAAIDWNRADDDALTKLDLHARLSPARRYTLVLTAGMTDVFGQALAHAVTQVLDAGHAPFLDIGPEEVFQAERASGGSHTVTVESDNLSAYDLIAQPLTELSLTRYLADSGPLSLDPLADARQHFPQARIEVVRPVVPFGSVDSKKVSLDALLGPDRGRGAALVVAETEGPTRVGAQIGVARLVTQSDLGITARMGLHGSIVWVTRFSDRKPVAGATVAVRDATGGEVVAGRTDESGMAVLPAAAYSPVTELGTLDSHAVVVVRSGDDWTFRPVVDALEANCKDPELGRDSLTGLVFTDRGDYELGDTIQVKALFKDERGEDASPLAGRSVHLAVTGAQGNLVSATDGKLDSYGGFTASVAIPVVERTGPWLVRADAISPSERESGSAAVSVRVLARGRTEAGIRILPDKGAYVRRDVARFRVEAHDALGVPSAGTPIRYAVRARPSAFVPPGASGRVTDDDAFSGPQPLVRELELKTGEASLGADGSMTSEVALPLPSATGPELVSIEANGRSSEGPVTGQGSLIVHPAEFYLALEPPRDFLAKGSALHANVAALSPTGQPTEGAPVHVELIDRRAVAAACDTVTQKVPTLCDLKVPRSGVFVLRATSRDARGNTVAASLPVYAPGPDADLASGAGGRIRLVSDRAAYDIGQTASVLALSPFKEADVLVSVEGGRGSRGERVHTSGPTPVLRVPITAEMAPSAHVSVVLLRTSGGAGKDTDSFAVGDLDLRVDPATRRLTVGISPVGPSAPGDFVESDVTVTDPTGAPVRASVTFYAVEDSGPRVKNLYAAFETAPAPSSYWIESRADLGAQLSSDASLAPLVPKAGIFGGSAERVPSLDLPRTAFFDGTLLTDVGGRVHTRFKLPDDLQALRLVAVASGEGSRFGAGEALLDTSPPVGVEARAPSHVRAGDAFEVTAAITSKGRAENGVVTLSAIGFNVGNEVTRTIPLAQGGRVLSRWSVRAPEAGRSEMVFRVRAGDLASETRLVRDIEAMAPLESVVLYGEASKAAAEGLGHFGNLRPDEGGLDLKVASSILVGLDDGLKAILEYPYIDTQQHVTRLVTLLGLGDLVKDYRVPIAEAGPWADREIMAILATQLGDGSFAAWTGAPATPGESLWRSTYALWALNLAMQHDHVVPNDAMTRALDFVRQSLSTWDRTPHDRAEAAFALDVLADMGFPDLERMEALFQARGHLPLFARALLAHAMTVAQMDNGLVDDLLGDAENHLRSAPDGATVVDEVGAEYGALLVSSSRTTAMVLRAFVARAKARAPNVFKKLRPPELVTRLARGLLAARRGGAWRTPEETIWALRALEDYRAAHVLNHPDVDAFFYLNGVELLKLPLHERKEWQNSASFGMRKLLGAHALDGVLGFRVKGDEEVRYEARLRYASAEPPREGVDRGFAIDKRVARLDGAPDAIRVGDAVVVDVLIITPVPRDHVILDDPLPGGLKATIEGVTRDYRAELRGDRVVVTFEHLPAGISHFRYVAEGASAGRYIVPPTRVFAAYEPEAFGVTPATTVEVMGEAGRAITQ